MGSETLFVYAARAHIWLFFSSFFFKSEGKTNYSGGGYKKKTLYFV